MTQVTKNGSNGARENERRESSSRSVYRPATDIFQSEEHLVLNVDLPGVEPEDIEVTLERGVLTIRGRVHSPTPEGYRRVHTEYGVGDFERAFTLSGDIDEVQISAQHKNGVLTLQLPKSERAKPKKIDVQAG